MSAQTPYPETETDADDWYEDEETPVYVTHHRVVTGVMLIASLLLFHTLAGVTFALISYIAPPDGGWSSSATLGDYVTGTRVLIALAVAAIGTVLFWIASDKPA